MVGYAQQVYIIEANPRASRTVPFVAKAIGHPLAAYASLLMSGRTLKDINFTKEVHSHHLKACWFTWLFLVCALHTVGPRHGDRRHWPTGKMQSERHWSGSAVLCTPASGALP